MADPMLPAGAASPLATRAVDGQPDALPESSTAIVVDADGLRHSGEAGYEPDDAAPLIDITPVLRESPPWLISAIVHMLLLLACALLLTNRKPNNDVMLEAGYVEDLGEQEIEENLDLAAEPEFEFDYQVLTPDELPQVDDPLATPEVSEISPNPTTATSTFSPIAIGMALTGRQPGTKAALLRAYGGDATTEAAVTLGLKWLARQQQRGGFWSLQGPYHGGSVVENREAATAMALLAFQGAGYTHRGDRQDAFTSVVRRGWNALLKQMDKDGNFYHQDSHNHALYTQAQCTIALCELFGMTGDETFRDRAQLAVDYCVKIQAPEGGWRYQPGVDSDTSVTGWFVMALQSARMAGLDVPSETFARIGEFLDSVQHDGGSQYAYQKRDGPKLALTAEGLLCRQYLGWGRDDERLTRGVEFLLMNPIKTSGPKKNVYYWYYATQVLHHMEGEPWKEWNNVMRVVIPDEQVTRGKERGSWAGEGDRYGSQVGRLYQTCLSLYMLEVYYRHLPMYHDGLLE